MSESQLDDLFQELEQVIDEDGRSLSADTTPSSMNDGSKPLGVGLAVVARYVRNMNGQIRVRSEIGKGTIFGIELPFEHASAYDIARMSLGSNRQLSSARTFSETDSPTIDIPRPKGTNTDGRTDSMTPRQEMTLPPQTTASPQNIITPGTLSSDLSSVSSKGGSPGKFPFPRMDTDPAKPKEILSVLIAEDNPINARLLTRRLLKSGHDVEV